MLQRHRFGPRSEKIDPDQLALLLEDVEQAIAARRPRRKAKRGQPAGTPVRRKRQINRGALPKHLAARGRRRRSRRQVLPLLQRRFGVKHRRGCLGTARHDPGALQGHRDAPAQIRLPRLRGRGGAGSGARASDRGRHSDRGADRGGASSPNTPTICRSIGRLRSMAARASNSTARRWPTGRGAPPSRCGPSTSDCSTS